jgi:hypothetical protein
MLEGIKDDAISWMNYTPAASTAEIEKTIEIVGDQALAKRLLDYGIRPQGALDFDASLSGSPMDKPREIKKADLYDDILVDIYTGNRFRYGVNSKKFVWDKELSNDYFDAEEILLRAYFKSRFNENSSEKLPFEAFNRDIFLMGEERESSIVKPLEFSSKKNGGLKNIIKKLEKCFVTQCGANRLWYRGQSTEYSLERSKDITKLLYGYTDEFSLIPSLGRFVEGNPDKAGFDLPFYASHFWKKPFLIWMMLENSHWFNSSGKHESVLNEILNNPDDNVFSQLLCEIQYSSSMFGEKSISQGLEWPDEVDDLRQWFFAFMKRKEFAVTLQQYGYPSSLLDVTNSIDVALYFSQAKFIDGKLKVKEPKNGRVMYVFAERNTGDFFHHGKELFWGEEDWNKKLPPRLEKQCAGFLKGSTCRARNFYGKMIIAKIWLDDETELTTLSDDDLFPYETDLLFKTLHESRPKVTELY